MYGDLSAFYSENWPRCEFSIDSVFWEFSVGSVFPVTHPKFVSMFKTFMCGHLCMVTFLHLIQESVKKIPPK